MFLFASRIVTLAVVCSTCVTAADAHAQARVPDPTPTGRWTGVYFGVGAGLGRGTPDSRVDWNDTALAEGPHPPAVPADYSKRIDGSIGVAQLGWNHRWGRVVTGLEADLSFGDINGDLSVGGPLAPPFVTPYAYEERLTLTRLGTVRGRLGFAPASRWLLHVSGGLAYGTAQAQTDLRFFSLSGVQSAQYRGSASETRMGWTIGAGTELALARSLSARLDYLHFDLGTMNVSGIRSPAFPTLFTVNEQAVKGQIVRVGLNYRFGAR